MAGNRKGRGRPQKGRPKGPARPVGGGPERTAPNSGAGPVRPSGAASRGVPARASHVAGVTAGATDVPEAVRGAWRGFLVLVFGELLAPVVGLVAPALGGLWLSLVAAAAYAVAGTAVGGARRAVLQGAMSAVGALALTMPLRVLVHERLALLAYAVSFTFALAVGGASGFLAGRRRGAA